LNCWDKLTITFGQRITPPAVALALSWLGAHDGGVGVAPEDDRGALRRTVILRLQPPVMEVARVTTVYLWVGRRCQFI